MQLASLEPKNQLWGSVWAYTFLGEVLGHGGPGSGDPKLPWPLHPKAVLLLGTDEIMSLLDLFCKLLASRKHHVRSKQGGLFPAPLTHIWGALCIFIIPNDLCRVENLATYQIQRVRVFGTDAAKYERR
jgi:hypothetical protein